MTWIDKKSSYVLIQMMAADLSHEVPSNPQRDTLINEKLMNPVCELYNTLSIFSLASFMALARFHEVGDEIGS